MAKGQPPKTDAKAIAAKAKKRAKKLLDRRGLSIREVRSQVAALKAKGIVSKRIDARSYQPSAYMLRKIKANKDVLSGEVIAVKAKNAIRKKYREAGIFETRGTAIIVPKERANQTAKIRRGLIETKTRLRNGEWRKIILPFKSRDLQDLATRLSNDESLDGLKDPFEFWGAKIFGHPIASGLGWPDANELGDYILRNYQHLFSGKNAKATLANFELVRFQSDDTVMPEFESIPKKIDDEYRRRNKIGREISIKRRKEKDAKRKARQRANETDKQRKERLDRQRERSRRNREANKRKG